MEYLEPLSTCDKILDLLPGRPSIDSYAIYHSLRSDTITGDMITNALSKLVDDKHLRTQGNFFNVGGDTLLFIQHGMRFGFEAQGERELLMARWNTLAVILQHGTNIPAKDAANAFALPPKS